MIALLLAAAFELHALVDSLDFSSNFDIEKDIGTLQTLEHVLGTYPTSVLWRDKGGGLVRYPSAEERSVYCEPPLHKLAFPRYAVYGYLRQHSRGTNALNVVREECGRRGFDFGLHTEWGDNHGGGPCTESNWVMEHPQFSKRSKNGAVGHQASSLAYPEVVAHKLRMVDERLAYHPKTIFLDLYRGGTWSAATEYVPPVIAEWKKRHDDREPPSTGDSNYNEWVELVSEYIKTYLTQFAAKCRAAGTKMLLGIPYCTAAEPRSLDCYVWKNYAIDYSEYADIVDGIVVMDITPDPERAFASTEETLSLIKSRCGSCKVYFHVNEYSTTYGIRQYAEMEGVSSGEAARELIAIARRCGCVGAIMACVDYRNYKTEMCDAIGDNSAKSGGTVVHWTNNVALVSGPTNVVDIRWPMTATLNAGTTDLARMAIRGGGTSVTLTGEEGAKMAFTTPTNAVTASNSGINADYGASITVDVPIISTGEFGLAGYGKVTLKSELSATTLALGKGEVTLDGGKLAVNAITMEAGGTPLKVTSGTISLSKDTAWDDLHLDSPTNLTLEATKAVKVTLPDGMILPDDFTIGANVTVVIPKDTRVGRRTSAAFPRVNILAGGCLHLQDLTSYLTTPIDLSLAEGGQVYLQTRSQIIAHRFSLADEEQPAGLYFATGSGATETIRGVKNSSSIAVPTTWSGKGDGTSWNDADNWEGGVAPTTAKVIPVDFSLVEGEKTIALDEDIKISALSYLPRERGILTFSGEHKFSISSVNTYQDILTIDKDSQIVFEVDLDNAAKRFSLMSGGGTVTLKKLVSPNFVSGNQIWLAVDGSLEIDCALNGPSFISARNGYVFSEIVFLAGAKVNLSGAMSVNYNGYTNLQHLRQEGGEVNTGSLNMMTFRSIDPLAIYTMNGGTLTLTEGIYLGAVNPNFPTSLPIPGGEFNMSGGVLTTPLLSTELNSNYYRFTGGEVHLGAGGIVKGDSPKTNAVPNTVPGLEFGGVTFVATESWTSAAELDILLTGEGGDTVFDIAEGVTVTLLGKVSGEGKIVKRGRGTLVFADYDGEVTIEEGPVGWIGESESFATAYGSVGVGEFYEFLRYYNRLTSPVTTTREGRREWTISMARSTSIKGMPLAAEYIAGTDPDSSNSVFKSSIEMTNGIPYLSWAPSLDGRVYRIYGSNDLKNWTEIASAAVSTYHFFKVTVEMK